MKIKDIRQLSHRMTMRYIFALALIAFLATTSFSVLAYMITLEHDRALVVNMAGKQRMLSQRTALYAHIMAHSQTDEELAINRATLQRTRDLFEADHLRLTRGGKTGGVDLVLSESMQDYYHNETGLDPLFHEYIEMIDSLLSLNDLESAEAEELLNRITDTATGPLLTALDEAVSIYQQEGENSVHRIRRLEFLILFMTVILLALEAFLIFRPMTNNVRLAMLKAIKAEQKAMRASRVKSRFLATMSHEIRTPLNAISGMTQLIKKDKLTPEQEDRISIISAASEHLLELTNDILDISATESGKFEDARKPCCVTQMARESLAGVQKMAADKNIELREDFHIEDTLHLALNKKYFRQILGNLLANACKFTHDGYVLLRIEMAGKTIQIEVEDSGIGIADDQQSKIFEPFYQAEDGENRRYDGAGLGLSICSNLALSMGGNLSVESQKGVGSLFRLVLPADIVPAPHTATTPEAPVLNTDSKPDMDDNAPRYKILVAEDNSVNQMLIGSVLKKAGHSYEIRENGKTALEALEEQDFDILIIDSHMPVMSGLKATELIRTRNDQKANIPILTLTANASEEHEARMLASGANAFMAKPFDVDVLLAKIRELVEAKLTSKG